MNRGVSLLSDAVTGPIGALVPLVLGRGLVMATMKTVEVWVKVDEDGDYDVGCDSSGAAERFTENVGDDAEKGTRLVKLMITLPLPVPFVATVDVPDTEGEPVVSVG